MTPGCAFNHIPDMKAGIDKLPIPSSYQVLHEDVDYTDKFLDLSNITVTRWYRSPLDFEGTCEQLRAAFKVSQDVHYGINHLCIIKTRVPYGWRTWFLSSYGAQVSVVAVPAETPVSPAEQQRRRQSGFPISSRPVWQPPDAFTQVSVNVFYGRSLY